MSEERIEQLEHNYASLQQAFDEMKTLAAQRLDMFKAVQRELETERCLSFRNQVAELERQRDELLADAERYRWLRIHGLQRAWVSLGTDCDGENFADFKCEFKVPEPPNLPYEDDEGLEWADKDFDAAIDAAIAAVRKEQK